MANEKSKPEPSQMYPSIFGSHKSMIDKEKTQLLNNPMKVICTDEHGDYETFVNRLDNGCADPNRYVKKRLNKLFNIHTEIKKEILTKKQK